jgi:chaperone modulatory protein CbpM
MSSIDRIFEGEVLDETSWFDLGEFCAHLHVERHWVVELVEAGVLEPRGPAPDAWSFPASALARARASSRLMNDLDVNLSAVALILDLIEERRRLLQRLEQLERLLEQ